MQEMEICNMNNEIKEKIPFNVRDVLEDINSNILWNYITNLQQENEIRQQDINNLTYQLAKEKEENERLKDSIDWWKDRFFGQQEYDDSHRITAIEYKKRIDKAIQLYQTCKEEDWCTLPIDMVNILQNGSEEK